MTARTLVVGEALVDIVHRIDGTIDEHPGGSPLNVAIGLARLGHPVHFATRFGRDAHGESIRAHLARERLLELTVGADDADKTSTAKAILDPTGAATYEFDLTWDVGEALDAVPTGHLHTGSIGATLAPGADAVLAAAQQVHANGTVSYDPNARPTLMGDPVATRAQVEALIACSDVVKASDEDIAWLYGDADLDGTIRRWASLGAAVVVVTRGKLGARVHVAGTGEWTDVPASGDVVVVDTVGAGDSFMSGLLSGLLDAGLLGGRDEHAALRNAGLPQILPAVHRAASCGDVTVSRAGANPPTRAELRL